MLDIDLLRLRRTAQALISPWRRDDTPGCTLGLVHEGALVLHEQAGLASVELVHPIGPETCFRIASVSKQFTCTAILLLEQEGRLSLDDAIQAHLPDLPDFGARISIAHLMHNASGIRDFLELMRLGGMDLPQPCGRDAPMQALLRQRSLNFAPASRYLYSNSNFLLLGRIVEAVAGEGLAAFLRRRVFAPLGMTRTRHVETTAEAVPGLATGYFPAPDGGFLRAGHGFPLGGEGGLVSCVEDLALWDRNFTTGLVGGAALTGALVEQMNFTNGRRNAYARGLQHHDRRGLRTVEHGGLWPGYKTAFVRVPERDLTVICIANFSTIDPAHIAQDLLDAAVAGTPGVHPVPPLPGRETLSRLVGWYLDRDAPATVEITLDETGEPVAKANGVAARLVPEEGGRLAATGSFVFSLRPLADGDAIEVERDAGVTSIHHRITPAGAPPEGLAGRYACDEVGAIWTIGAGADGGVAVTVEGPIRKAGPWRIAPVEGDILRILVPSALFEAWLDVRVRRNGAGAVESLLVNSGRARGLVFTRLAP